MAAEGRPKVGAWLRRALHSGVQGEALPLPWFALRRTGGVGAAARGHVGMVTRGQGEVQKN